MSTAVWVAIAGVIVTMLLNVGTFLVAWGFQRAMVAALRERVSALEAASPALTDLKVEIGKLTVAMTNLGDRVTEIKDEAHQAFTAMDGKVAEINHLYRNRISAMEAADHLAARGRS